MSILRNTAATLLGLALLSSAGCHLFYPFDLAAADAQSQPDRGLVDAPAEAAAFADGRADGTGDGTADGPADGPTDGPADGTAEGPPCNEPPLVNPTALACQQQGTACAGSPPADQDCDGLIDARDPAPSGCNLLRFADDFGAPPAAGSWSPGNGYTWSCGELRPAEAVTLSLAGSLAGQIGIQPLVSVGLITPKPLPGPAQQFTVMLHLQAGSDSTTCVIEKESSSPATYLKIKVNGVTGVGASTTVDEGALHVLQLYHEPPYARCRLFRPSKTIATMVSAQSSQAKPVNALQVTATGMSIALDYVHAFKQPP